MTEYEKYQLQWMIDHDVSLNDLIYDIADYIYEEPDEATTPQAYDDISLAYHHIINENGFSKNGQCFVSRQEWNQFKQ